MLSPASLRVCCLAVMAPALTKADRQADCLPVVLSESFCVSKSPDTFTREDKISEIRLKCAYSSEYVLNRKKPFMHRACWRTPKSGTGFLNKYRSINFDSSKSLLCSGRVRTQRDGRLKSWQNTNATTAYADKIKLKYTMSKNITNAKNMGLAKANTSLGLQSLKKVKYSKENQSSSQNVMEDSMTFSDSTDSAAQMGPLISDITVLTTNTESDVLPVDEAAPCTNNKRTSASEDQSNIVSSTAEQLNASETVLENDSQSFLTSAGADLMEAMDTSNTSVILTDLLCSTVETVDSIRNSPTNSVSALPCNFLPSSETDVVIESEAAEIPNSSIILESADDQSYELVEKPDSNIQKENDNISLQSLVFKETPSSVFEKFLDFKLPVLNNKFPGTPLMSSSLFSTLTCSKLLKNACKISNPIEEPVKSSVLDDCRFGLNYAVPVRKEKKVCCLPSNQELESLATMLSEKSVSINSVLSRSILLLRKQLNAHAKKQISSLVEHYQRKYQIPCQRPTKHVNTKSDKDLVDLKAELLQSEDVKSMSTAALVSLVRKLESGSQGRIMSPKMTCSSPETNENATLSFDPDDCDDIKHTSGVMLSNLKNLLKLSDPYFTDSSEDDYATETDDDDEFLENEVTTDEYNDKCGLWKYLTERAALASSSTWLLARSHELGFCIKEYNERWSEMVKAEGQVCLEEPTTSQSSVISVEHNSNTESYVKQATVPKGLPLNGFLDPSDASHIARTPVSESFMPELENSIMSEYDKVEGNCWRTKPLDVSSFRKRKLAFIPGLHASNPKFCRLSTVSCYCNSQSEMAPCILCTGQYNCIQSIDPDSMALRDRIALLDPYFHPVLSSVKDIPVCLQLENYMKIEAKYHNVQPVLLPERNVEGEEQQSTKIKFSDMRSHRKLSRYTRTLSAKYRNKHHRNSRHLRKHKLVFGKWRRLNNKHTLCARTRFRRHSVASSGSSPDSPVHSPMSVYDDGFEDKRRDDNKFDIDDVIIPCNSRRGRLVNLQYKEIITPSWRSVRNEELALLLTDTCEIEETEDITESSLIKRHALLELEEKERMKRNALGLNRRRRNRCESRADSSGANTPDPTSLFNQDIFQVPNFTAATSFPTSPASPATPNSGIISDDSQPSFGNTSNVRPEKKKISNQKRLNEDSTSAFSTVDYEEVSPFEPLQFPLSDEVYEALLAESDHDKEDFDLPSFSPTYPASPISSSSSTSTVEEEEEDIDDITDPEWTVVKPMKSGPEQALVLKFAKR